ncbi:hypothetical protein TNCV_4427281 [Trichonephila clavipes]|nr:hypothetical protein TNCV_4427281 [Trichonephila clavipes]
MTDLDSHPTHKESSRSHVHTLNNDEENETHKNAFATPLPRCHVAGHTILNINESAAAGGHLSEVFVRSGPDYATKGLSQCRKNLPARRFFNLLPQRPQLLRGWRSVSDRKGRFLFMVADEHPAVHRTALRGLHNAADRPGDASDQRHLHLPPAQKTTGHTLRGRRPPFQIRMVLLDSAGGR